MKKYIVGFAIGLAVALSYNTRAGLSNAPVCLTNFQPLIAVRVLLPATNRVIRCSTATVMFDKQTLTTLLCFE